MHVRSVVRQQLAKRAPRLEEAAVRARWRRRNRDRALSGSPIDETLDRVFLQPLVRDGIAIGSVDDLFGGRELFEELGAEASRLYDEHHATGAGDTAAEKPFLTRLLATSFDADDVFLRVALHRSVLAVANGYMRMRTTLRALNLWLTRPTPGDPVQTQLWHRDGDDYMNVKLFLLLSDVTDQAGPFVYAPRTHPLGDRRTLPERDEHGRSRDEQMAAIVPELEWVFATGKPGTVVFAETCGYHKQQKPTGAERLMLMSQYVSGTAYGERAIDIRGANASALSADQRVAVFDA